MQRRGIYRLLYRFSGFAHWGYTAQNQTNWRPRSPIQFSLWMAILGVAIAAAVIAVAIAVMRGGQAAWDYRVEAAWHSVQARGRRHAAQFYDKAARDYRGADRLLAEYYRSVSDAETKRAEYHEALFRKYKGAAAYPWLPVSPDPFEPELPTISDLLRRRGGLKGGHPNLEDREL